MTDPREALSRLTRWRDVRDENASAPYPDARSFVADVSALLSQVANLRAIIGPKAHCAACGSVVEMEGERAGECHCTLEGTGTQRLGPHDSAAYDEIAALRGQLASLTIPTGGGRE